MPIVQFGIMMQPNNLDSGRPQPAASRPTHTCEPKMIDARAAARMHGVSVRKWWELVACQAVPSVRIGRRVLFDVDELEAWRQAGCPTAPGSAAKVKRLAREIRSGSGRG